MPVQRFRNLESYRRSFLFMIFFVLYFGTACLDELDNWCGCSEWMRGSRTGQQGCLEWLVAFNTYH